MTEDEPEGQGETNQEHREYMGTDAGDAGWRQTNQQRVRWRHRLSRGEPTQDRIFPWLDSREKISVTKACKSGQLLLCDRSCRQMQKHMIQQGRQTYTASLHPLAQLC